MKRTITGYLLCAGGLILAPIMGGVKWDKLGFPAGITIVCVGVGIACLMLYAGGRMLTAQQKKGEIR